jgi:hypothetical protein
MSRRGAPLPLPIPAFSRTFYDGGDAPLPQFRRPTSFSAIVKPSAGRRGCFWAGMIASKPMIA